MASPFQTRTRKESRRRTKQPPARSSAHRLLRKTWVAGVIIALATGGALAFFVKHSGQSFFLYRNIPEEGVFSRKLREYDQAVENSTAGDGERLTGLLDDLEKTALGVESHLSVLKRRRAWAVGSGGSGAGRSWSGSDDALAAYKSSAVRAAAAFPYSGPLAAVAAEAVTRAALRESAGVSPPLSGVIADEVRRYAAAMSGDPRLAPLALGAYVLSGDMADPGTAVAIPNGEALLQAGAERRRGRESLILNAAILAVLKNDAQAALERLAPLLEQPAGSGNPGEALRFGAELLYDFGDPQRAADLFARFGDDRGISRRADALVLAGQKDAARNIWAVLSAPDLPGPPPELPSPSEGSRTARQDIRIRSLYNLAAAAKDRDEEAAALERLLALDREHLFGMIRYTRLLPASRAVVILEDSVMIGPEPLADLELLRRRREVWTIDRTIPETWLLINRHPETEALYQWAGYYFAFQRRYYEIPPLLRAADRKGFTGSWLNLQRALEHIREGRLDAAAELLKDGSRARAGGSWETSANLGRLLEARRSYTAALESYERAAALVRKNTDAAKIQLGIARCLRALGQERESLRVLNYAQTLDSGNLTIRLERERLEQSLY